MSVGVLISRAWKFMGRRVVPLLGLGWLSAAFYGVAVAYFLDRLSGAMLVWPRPDAGNFNNFALFYLFCLVVLTAFANAIMGLPMTREALEPGGEWKTAYFSVARREWSIFANLLLLYVIVIGLVAAILFAGNVGIAVSLPMIGHDGVWNGIALAPIMSGTLMIIAVAVGLFLATRLGFFLAPIAVADPPARLLQAWISSRGSFWRLLTASLALLLPVLVLAVLATWAVSGAKFGDAVMALFSTPRNMTPFFQLIQNNAPAIAAIWAVALLLWNALFAGASADAYAQAEHGVEAVSSHEFVSVAEPAFAMAAVPPHAAVVDAQHVEPAFAAVEAEEVKPAAKAPEPDVKAEETTAPAAEPVAHREDIIAETPPASASVVEVKAPEADHQAEEIEFKTVEDPPSPVAAADPIAEEKSADEEVHAEAASVETHEEPLAEHKDALPAMDPLSHAAPAEPDPTGEPAATPLPSFVKTQASPEHEPSEAA